MPNIVIIEHESGAPLALFDTWMTQAGAEITVCRPWAGDEVPPLTSFDGWLVLGGEVGAYDDEVAGWLPTVKDRIAHAATQGTPMLGICLGHQLVAVATGGRVTKNPAGQRAGLYDVGWTPAAVDDPLVGGVATPRRAVQWNGDVVVELPEHAVLLASSESGEVQAARFAPSVWGVQWHPEVDRAVVESWSAGQREDYLDRGIDTDATLAEIDAAASELEDAWRPLAEAFVARVGELR